MPLLLLGVIFVSGCTGIPDVFGGNVIKVQTRTVEEGVKDSLVIKDILTIPNSPLLPDQEVILSFVLENREKVRPVNNIRIDLFNAPGFRPEDAKDPKSPNFGKLCNSGAGVCRPEGDDVKCDVESVAFADKTTTVRRCRIPSLLPGEERLVQYRLLAPTREQIANIKTQARLDFKVLYDFEGSMNFVMPAVNKDEVIRRQREGQALNIIFEKSVSSGPVRIDVEPLGVNYLLENFPTIMLFSIKNVGSGTIVNSEIACFAGRCAEAQTPSQTPGAAQENTQQQTDPDLACRSLGGTCMDVNSGGCSGHFRSGLCPSNPSADFRCCVPGNEGDFSCTSLGGTCQYKDRYTCPNDNWQAGKCLSDRSSNYQCCLPSQSAGQPSPAGQAQQTPQTLTNLLVGLDANSPQGLRISFQKELDVVQTPGDVLEIIFGKPQTTDAGLVFQNQKKIQIFRDRSQTSLRFPVKLGQDTYEAFKAAQVPFRSYQIKSNVYYTYELRSSADVAINIFENV